MPDRIRLPALILNGLLLIAFLLMGIASLAKGPGLVVFCLLIAAIGGFNIHVVRTSARLLGEEEWLRAEIRKEELRHELTALRAKAARRDASRLIEGSPP